MARFTSMLISGCAQCVGRGLGIFTVAVACLLICDVIFVYSHYTLPLIAIQGSLGYYLLLSCMSIISFGVLFNYYLALGVCPGYIPFGNPELPSEMEEVVMVEAATKTGGGGRVGGMPEGGELDHHPGGGSLINNNTTCSSSSSCSPPPVGGGGGESTVAAAAVVTIDQPGAAVRRRGAAGTTQVGGCSTTTYGGDGGDSSAPTQPGCLPPVISLRRKHQLAPGQYGGPGNEMTYCRRCDAHRPARSHHCILCGRCVLKMDHHCPWVNTCVGYHNQRYFFLFLFWLLIGTFYTGCGYTCVYYDSCVGVWSEKAGGRYFVDDRVTAFRESTILLFSLVLVIALFVAMCGFVGWNFYMILTNQTSIESQSNSFQAASFSRSGLGMFRNAYDLGRQRNLKEVFAAVRGGPAYSRSSTAVNTNTTAPLPTGGGTDGVNPSKWPLWIVRLSRWTHHVLDDFEKGNGIVGGIGMSLPSVQPMPGDGHSYPTFYTESGTNVNSSSHHQLNPGGVV